MNKADIQYLDHARRILEEGTVKADRTGTGTRSIFGHQMRFDLREGFPLLTTKKVHFKSIVTELLWFLRGDTNVKWLQEHGCKIWDEWSSPEGELGPVYGKQWRRWEAQPTVTALGEGEYSWQENYIDQIAQVIETLKTNPDSRRMIVSAWNVEDLPRMALEPCHVLFQFYTVEMTVAERIRYALHAGLCKPTSDLETHADISIAHTVLDTYEVPRRYIDCQLYQRSADWFLGVPFNIASYALLMHMIGKVVNMAPRHFVHTFGDSHIYSNHEEQIREQLTREPRALPKLVLTHTADWEGIDGFTHHDFHLCNYDPHPLIKGAVAI